MAAKRISPVGRASYPNLWTPTNVQGQGALKYRLSLIFEPDDPELQAMKKVAEETILAKYPDGNLPANFRKPFIDGDTMGDPHTAGKIVVRFSANADRRPGVVGPRKESITQEDGAFYAGCYARVSYSCYCYDKAGNKGCAFGMNNVQKVRDGEALDGRTNADDDFEVVDDSPGEESFSVI
jgi:hypothetical protein